MSAGFIVAVVMVLIFFYEIKTKKPPIVGKDEDIW